MQGQLRALLASCAEEFSNIQRVVEFPLEPLGVAPLKCLVGISLWIYRTSMRVLFSSSLLTDSGLLILPAQKALFLMRVVE